MLYHLAYWEAQPTPTKVWGKKYAVGGYEVGDPWRRWASAVESAGIAN